MSESVFPHFKQSPKCNFVDFIQAESECRKVGAENGAVYKRQPHWILLCVFSVEIFDKGIHVLIDNRHIVGEVGIFPMSI